MGGGAERIFGGVLERRIVEQSEDGITVFSGRIEKVCVLAKMDGEGTEQALAGYIKGFVKRKCGGAEVRPLPGPDVGVHVGGIRVRIGEFPANVPELLEIRRGGCFGDFFGKGRVAALPAGMGIGGFGARRESEQSFSGATGSAESGFRDTVLTDDGEPSSCESGTEGGCCCGQVRFDEGEGDGSEIGCVHAGYCAPQSFYATSRSLYNFEVFAVFRMRIFLATIVTGASGVVQAAPIPPAVAAMIEAAAGDADKLQVVADVARMTNPDSVAEIDARIAAIETARAEAREQALASQGFFEGWKGSGEAGAFISTGNTNTQGVALGLNLSKETRSWKHAFRGFVDYQRQEGVTTRERFFGGYEGNYNITPDLYALLTLSYERDRFSGFNSRFAESLGIGYKLLKGPRVRLAMEAGPALRQTRFTDGLNANTFAARGALNAGWKITDGIELTEDASVFYDSTNTSFQSLTALTARINGALSARMSVQFNSESNPPLGRKNTDTTSRVTLVYGF